MKRNRKFGKPNRFPEPEFLPKPEMQKTSVGRTVWKTEYVRHVFYLSLLGATDVQIAQTFGVDPSTVERWKRDKPEFLESMRRGKMEADGKVVYSLFLAAVGYSHPDEVILTNRVKEYNDEGKVVKEYTKPLRVKTVKNYPPNVTAALKWLQARQPEVWGNRLEVKGDIKHHHEIDLSKFSTNELEVLSKLGLQQHVPNIEDVPYVEEEHAPYEEEKEDE
jgi:hypothetical protein